MLIVGAIIASLRNIKNSIPIEVYRSQAKKQFMELQVRSHTPQLAFSGAQAEIIKSDESLIKEGEFIESYSLTCYARNDHGEYFMFVSNYGASPFFKHISHTNAKILFGDDYREPT